MMLKNFGHLERARVVFGKILNFGKFYRFGQIFIAVNGQILNKLSSHLITLVGNNLC